MELDIGMEKIWEILGTLIEKVKHKWDNNYDLWIHEMGVVKFDKDNHDIARVFGAGIEKYFKDYYYLYGEDNETKKDTKPKEIQIKTETKWAVFDEEDAFIKDFKNEEGQFW